MEILDVPQSSAKLGLGLGLGLSRKRRLLGGKFFCFWFCRLKGRDEGSSYIPEDANLSWEFLVF